jgi:hypothetical protein
MPQSNTESSDKTLEVLEQLYFEEYDALIKVTRLNEQGSGKPKK